MLHAPPPPTPRRRLSHPSWQPLFLPSCACICRYDVLGDNTVEYIIEHSGEGAQHAQHAQQAQQAQHAQQAHRLEQPSAACAARRACAPHGSVPAAPRSASFLPAESSIVFAAADKMLVLARALNKARPTRSHQSAGGRGCHGTRAAPARLPLHSHAAPIAAPAAAASPPLQVALPRLKAVVYWGQPEGPAAAALAVSRRRPAYSTGCRCWAQMNPACCLRRAPASVNPPTPR